MERRSEEAQPPQDVAATQEDVQPQEEEVTTKRATAEDDNKFQLAIAAWRDVDLTGLVPKLDATATDIVEHQRVALEQRKDLAQKTRDFRKLDDSGKLAEYKALLKGESTWSLLTGQLLISTSLPIVHRRCDESVESGTGRLSPSILSALGSAGSIPST